MSYRLSHIAAHWVTKRELLMYMYPKLKNVEVSGDMEHLVKVVQLTPEEIDAFEKRFNDDF